MRHSYKPVSLADAAVRPRWDVTGMVLGSMVFTGLMALSAISFRLWFTPIPMTLQVMMVILSGLVLGSRWGAVSQIQYLALGAMGLPIFSNFMGGPGVFFGPTGGYLVGFVLGAFVVGWVFERLSERTSLAAWIAGVAGIAAIYLFGASWLAVWVGVTSSQALGASLQGAWQLGIVPFIGIDLLKAVVASGLAAGGKRMGLLPSR